MTLRVVSPLPAFSSFFLPHTGAAIRAGRMPAASPDQRLIGHSARSISDAPATCSAASCHNRPRKTDKRMQYTALEGKS